MKVKHLSEGMRAGDLNNLLLPLISVDEYESKIDPSSAIAIGFYVHERDAANDLNRFLQKSPTELLSSEVSPAPDQHGYYIVFVEFLVNNELFENLSNILHEIEPLCEIETWKMHVRKADKPLAFNEENFIEALKKARSTDHENHDNEEHDDDHAVNKDPDVTESSRMEMRDLIKMIEGMEEAGMGHNGGPSFEDEFTLSPIERQIMDEIKANSNRQTHIVTFAGRGAKDGLKTGGRQRLAAAKRLRDKGLVAIQFLDKEWETRNARTIEYSNYMVRET